MLPPEACPGEEGNTNRPAEVVSTGHIALFDVYWLTGEEELANNPCPPTVVHVAAEYDDREELVTPARDDRSPSNINIEHTVIHIPNSARIDLNATTTYDEEGYSEVWEADNEENRNGSGTGDGIVWVLPPCPDGALTDSLCFGFSADLLNPEDWGIPDDKESAPGPVQFLVDHAHQHDVGVQGGRYVLAYLDADGDGSNRVTWDTFDADHNVVEVAPGEYEYPTLVLHQGRPVRIPGARPGIPRTRR